MDEVILTRNVSKYYGKVRAVDGISLRVRKGEIYGCIGLNGAGKTTMIRLLLGMIHPTTGASFVCGKQVHSGSHDLWKNIGYLVETPHSYPDLTVRENLEIVRRLRFISDTKSVDAVIDKLQLGPYAERKAKHLSLGNAQRLGLAKALLHNPEILILDEPTNGMDPAGIVEIRNLLRSLPSDHGVTIFISSHILGEISKLTTRIGIIHEGRLIQEVDTNQLDHLRRKCLLLNTFDNSAAQALLSTHGYPVNVSEEGTLEVTSQHAIDHPEAISTLLVQAGLPPTLVRVDEENLESYFLRVIGMQAGAK